MAMKSKTNGDSTIRLTHLMKEITLNDHIQKFFTDLGNEVTKELKKKISGIKVDTGRVGTVPGWHIISYKDAYTRSDLTVKQMSVWFDAFPKGASGYSFTAHSTYQSVDMGSPNERTVSFDTRKDDIKTIAKSIASWFITLAGY